MLLFGEFCVGSDISTNTWSTEKEEEQERKKKLIESVKQKRKKQKRVKNTCKREINNEGRSRSKRNKEAELETFNGV